METPCCTTRYCSRIWSRDSKESKPPSTMKFFRNDFKPIDHRFLGKNVPVVGNPQTNAHAIIGEAVESIGGHGKSIVSQSDKSTGRDEKSRPVT